MFGASYLAHIDFGDGRGRRRLIGRQQDYRRRLGRRGIDGARAWGHAHVAATDHRDWKRLVGGEVVAVR
jgi:hypothetical protein